MDAEAWCLLGLKKWRYAGGKEVCFLPSPSGTRILALRSGVGPGSGLEGARWLIGQGVRALLSVGIAGGLHPGLKAGDLVVADRVIMAGGEGEKMWTPDPACTTLTLSMLAQEGVQARKGPIATVDSAVSSASEKALLHRKTRALTVDMESGGVARAAAESNIPFLALRVVIDGPSRSLDPVLSGCLDERGKIRLDALWRGLCRRPFLLFELIRMARDLCISLSALRRAWGVQVRQVLPALDL